MTDRFDVSAFRAHFPSLPRLTYLNSGSYGLLAREVREAFDAYLNRRVERGADWGGWVGELEAVRGRVAQLLQVSPDEVAITGSASAGLNALAAALDFPAGRDTVLVSNFEFPSSAQIWHAQEKAGARILHVPEGEGGTIPLAHFERLIDERTRVVALSHLCYRHGGRIPDADIRAIAALAHARGALVVLDSYQIVGSMPVHPKTLDVDVCAGGMLKYLLGTAGIGFLYVRSDLIEGLRPRATGWFAQADIDAMDIFANDPSATARRFESGTPPVPSLAPVRAGIELLLDTGLEAIGDQVRRVTRHALDRLAAAGIAIGNPDNDDQRGPLVSVLTTNEQALVAALAERDIITSSRDGKLRAGFHAYNTEEDADRLVAALIKKRDLLP